MNNLVLSTVGDLELARRELVLEVAVLKARIAELEAEAISEPEQVV